MKRSLTLLTFSVLPACQGENSLSRGIGEVAGQATVAAFNAIADGLAQKLDDATKRPGAFRASLGMTCGSRALCERHVPAETDQCASESVVWQGDFLSLFGVCLSEGETREACFDRARDALPIGTEERASGETCRLAVATCGVQTDACDALELVSYPELAQALESCSQAPCETMNECFLKALIGTRQSPSDIDGTCVVEALFYEPDAGQ